MLASIPKYGDNKTMKVLVNYQALVATCNRIDSECIKKEKEKEQKGKTRTSKDERWYGIDMPLETVVEAADVYEHSRSKQTSPLWETYSRKLTSPDR